MNQEKIEELIKIKKSNVQTLNDIKKIELIERLLKEKDCFFKMDSETAIGILEFLDVPENQILSSYFQLISTKNYEKNVPKQRISIPKK